MTGVSQCWCWLLFPQEQKKVIIIWYSGHFLTNKVPLAFKDPKRLHVLVE